MSPIKPDRPGTLLLLVMAASGGIILGIGIVLVLEQMRQGFRSTTEVAQFLSLPSIGMLPLQSEKPSGGADRPTAARYALDHPSSAYAKNLRAIRTRLVRSGSKSRGEILAVISALPGEGKSTFACNFALAAAGSGVRTLLIDGDVYTTATSQVFGLKKAGLSELLEGKTTFWHAISKDTKSGLHILGARDTSVASDDVKDIDGVRLAALLREFGKHFDVVVIDSPAILPVGGSAPHLECADRAILLVEWDQTERQAVAEALDMLDSHGRKLAGVVLNKVSVGWCRLFDYGAYLKYPADAKCTA
jgi:polysaccharide biosynthesis transport protein